MPKNKTDTWSIPGARVSNHFFLVPLDYKDSGGKKLEIFCRQLVSPDNAERKDVPFLIFLQGGPGFESPRPESVGGWIKRALKEYRVLLLDQRGTGLSSPVTHQSLAALPDARAQAEYLRHFRADNIVRDCEFIRQELAGDKPWTALGQSYGGFCITSYLSLAPEGLAAGIITGGLAPLGSNPDAVYRATYKIVIEKNRLFYDQYPQNKEIVARIVEHLASRPVKLTTGETLTPRRFLQLGLNLGFVSNGFASLHYLLERAFVPGSGGDELSYAFLRGVENALGFNTNPIYALLHESIYCQKEASNWSAARILSEYPQFGHECRPVLFTGEMVYPWMFDEYACLQPLKGAAEMLASYKDWPVLHDRAKLKENNVPCVAAVYYDDMYVDRVISEDTARTIRGLKLWITNEHEHDGLRADGDSVLDRLINMLRS